MSKLPILSWREVVKALSKRGFKVVRQRGSHLILEGPEHRFTVVPRHETIAPATLIKILSQVGVTKEEFIKLLD
ncbi:MAG: type II toxin-antitoxin system HicA family toxin [Thermoproteota archaeon]|nr:type II toxin-antitoxin system HicA family toxin [Candidatus Brockarchaeota archaeon]